MRAFICIPATDNYLFQFVAKSRFVIIIIIILFIILYYICYEISVDMQPRGGARAHVPTAWRRH